MTKDLYVISSVLSSLKTNDDESAARAPCAFCGGDQMLVVASVEPTVNSRPLVRWLRCVSCFHGVVENETVVSPAERPLDTPDVLEGEDLAAWTEVRACLSVGANTAAVMMCRKLLFHVAAAHGLPVKNSKGRAPTFEDALKHLEDEGVFTKRMRPWIDRIKNVGNEANHEIPCITSDQAMDVALFTRQLVSLAYELPAMVAKQAGGENQDSATS